MRVLFVPALVLLLAQTPASTDWRQFRGPDGAGLVQSRRLPLTWAEGQHIRWKTAIHGRAWSSPVVLGSQVWLSTASEDGHERFAVAVDRETGRIVHDLKLFDVGDPKIGHAFNSFASPSPVVEPGRVYVTFGSPGTAALDARTGKILWQRRDLECNHFRGAGSSPILFRNLLIMHFDGSDQQYVVALDKNTGKTVWKTLRSIDFQDLGPDGKPQADGDFRKAFSTPLVTMVDGRPLLLSLGAKAAYGYDPLTGQELWRIEERTNHSASTVPAVGHGLAFYPSGFSSPHLMAIRMDGRGDATSTHVVWRVTRGVPQKPSIVLVGDLIFMINDAGIASAVEAKTGAVVWTGRVGGSYSASPISDGARVYFFSEEGKATVIEAGRQFKVLAENVLDDGFMASPAVSGDALFLRTRTHLYRVEQ
jgi:outer membrane protein assembly factor BamB